MTADQYRTALATLGLSQLAAGRWLGVSSKTAQRYATTGPSGAAARAVAMAVAVVDATRYFMDHDLREAWAFMEPDNHGPYVRHADMIAAIDLPTK